MKNSKLLVVALSSALLLTACGKKEANNTQNTTNNTAVESEVAEGKTKVDLHRAYLAPHGEGAFARVIVATSGDKILGANIDEFQFLGDDAVQLPNADKEFGQGYAEGKSLASKKENDELYSNMMKEKAGATKSIKENYEAIENFVAGKTIEEVEKVIKDAKDGEPVDAVSSATLADTKGYLQAIVDTAKQKTLASQPETDADLSNLKLAQAYAGNGDSRYVTDAVVLKDGDKIVATNIDELLFMENGEGVPNSDKDFGQGYKDAKSPLVSKKMNNDEYSKMMKEYAKSTKTMMENYEAIEDFTEGKTATELEDVASKGKEGEPIDAVSSATLSGTGGLLKDIAQAAK